MVLSQKINRISPLARAILVIGAVAALVTGITFAQFTDTASMTGFTMASGTADLKVDGSDAGTEPSDSEAGFTFEGLAPGEESEPQTFALRNDGDVDLNVTAFVTPSAVTGLVDNSKIHFCFNLAGSTDEPTCYTRAEMLANFNDLPGNPLLASETPANVDYELFVKVDADHPGSGFSIALFDMTFTGTQVESAP
jgi:hypothetical protein